MENLGSILKKRREQLGKSIDEIEKITNIRKRYLEAMEQEKWEVFPGRVYLRGFIRTYSRYLGLDETETLNMLNALNVVETEQPKPLPEKIEIPGKPKRKSAVILAVAAIFLLFMAQYVYRHYLNAPLPPANQPDISENTPDKPSEPEVTPPGSANPEQPPADSPAVEAPAAEPAEPIEGTDQNVVEDLDLVIKAVRGTCWTEVRSGRTLLYEGTLTIGREVSFNSLKSCSFTLGSAGAVTVLINGEELELLGKIGDVVKKTFAVENNEIKELTS